MALSMSQEELLNFAVENGMLDLAYVQDKINMQKREEILKAHPYTIWEGKNGSWYTYLPDDKKGRLLKKRKSKESIENLVVEYYENDENNKEKSNKELKRLEEEKKKETRTFSVAFYEYVKFQLEEVGVKNNTYSKYLSDFNRFFKGTKIEQQLLIDINSETLRAFLTKRTKELKLRLKAFKSMYGYINSTFIHAVANHRLPKDDNPMDLIEAKNFYQYCMNPLVDSKSRTFSEIEIDLLYMKLDNDAIEKPDYIPNYAVRFNSYAGMRVGEVAALGWDMDYGSFMIINRSEKYDRVTKEYYIEQTKTGKERIVPITRPMRIILDTVKELQRKYHIESEFIFAYRNSDGIVDRSHTRILSDCAARKSKQAGLNKGKSMHALRRTVNSNMRSSGVPVTVAASILGHSEEVNEKNYTYDMSSIIEKREYLELGNKVKTLCVYKR